jgi:hypothetical protein
MVFLFVALCDKLKKEKGEHPWKESRLIRSLIFVNQNTDSLTAICISIFNRFFCSRQR